MKSEKVWTPLHPRPWDIWPLIYWIITSVTCVALFLSLVVHPTLVLDLGQLLLCWIWLLFVYVCVFYTWTNVVENQVGHVQKSLFSNAANRKRWAAGTAQVQAPLGRSAEEGEHTCEHCRTFLSLNLKNIFALRSWHFRALTSYMQIHWERATKLKG